MAHDDLIERVLRLEVKLGRMREALAEARQAIRLLKGDAFVGSRIQVTEDRYPSLKAANAAERTIAAALASEDSHE